MIEFFLTAVMILAALLIIICWRVMKAHEALAKEAKKFNEADSDLTQTKKDLVDQKKRYHQFIRENPEVDDLSSKDRHNRFREWLIEQ